MAINYNLWYIRGWYQYPVGINHHSLSTFDNVHVVFDFIELKEFKIVKKKNLKTKIISFFYNRIRCKEICLKKYNYW